MERMREFLSGKRLLLACGIVVAFLLLLLFFLGAVRSGTMVPGQGGKDTDESGKYQREGYKNVGSGVADPAAIVSNGKFRPVTYGGAPVVQACNLLALDQLNEHKVRLHPNPIAGTYERSYISDDTSAPIVVGTSVLAGQDINSCQYDLTDKSGISIDVSQQSYMGSAAITYLLSKFTRQAPSQNGVAISVRDVLNDYKAYLLQKDGVYAEVSFVGSSDKKNVAQTEANAKKLLPVLTKNFAREVAKPSGTPQYKYASPVFKKTAALGCQLITAGNFQTVFGAPPSPAVHEEIPTAVGSIAGFEGSGDEHFAYIQNVCRRSASSPNATSSVQYMRLSAQITSYENAKGAKNQFGYDKPGDKGAPLSRPAGDDSYVVTVSHIADPGTVVIRKDRFLIKLSMSDLGQRNETPPMYYADKLAPIIPDVLSRLPK